MNNSVVRPGRIEEITSSANPRIKSIKALSMKKNRDAENIFLVEGQKLVTDALQKRWKIRTLIHSKKLLDDELMANRVVALATKVRAQGGDIFISNDKLLTSITRRDNPQAVVAVIEQKLTPLKEVVGQNNDCWVALDRVRDPGNLGTIIRTADALGAKGVLLVGECTDPFALEAVRATMGSLFHTKLSRATTDEFMALANRWGTSGGQVIGTHLHGSLDHRSIDYTHGPQLLLMGNEQQGLTDDLAKACTKLALISMAGAADSLNLAVATGIMLFEIKSHSLAQAGT